jgi:hypothetical protein
VVSAVIAAAISATLHLQSTRRRTPTGDSAPPHSKSAIFHMNFLISVAMAYLAKITPGSPAVALQVFETVELMEEILMLVTARDVLSAMQAVTAMRDTVSGSVKVQRAIGLLPDPTADFSVPLWECIRAGRRAQNLRDFHGITYFDYGKRFERNFDYRFDDHVYAEPKFHEVADFILTAAGDHCLYKLGSRCRQLSICQPAACKEMEISYRCRNCGDPDLWDYEITLWDVGTLTASNSQYITMGDVYSAIIKARQRHRASCQKPKAKAEIEVEFRGSVRLNEGDGTLKKRPSDKGFEGEFKAMDELETANFLANYAKYWFFFYSYNIQA